MIFNGVMLIQKGGGQMIQDNMAALEQIISRDYDNIAGIVVSKAGEVCYEKYFNQCSAASTIHVYSVTKSIISILIGIAIDHGDIASLDQRVVEFFPDYPIGNDERTIRSITIRNMLTMTVPYKYRTEPYVAYFTSDNWVTFALDLLGGSDRVGDFHYAPIVGPDILSGILTKATGRSVLDFAKEYLFAPLGITVQGNVVFGSQAEQLAFNEAVNISGWVADQQGVNAAGWGLTLSAMDMAKIGQLYIAGGKWAGRQIVPAVWVAESTREHSRWGELPYGYLWWILDAQTHSYAAIGDGGNVIYVNTEKELVVAIVSLFMPKAKDRIELIKGHIEPLFQ